jgi:hypothetical protein
MWTIDGYIIHRGIYPITAEYLIYDELKNEINWTDDSNVATVFNNADNAKKSIPDFNNDDYKIRLVVRTDIAIGI